MDIRVIYVLIALVSGVFPGLQSLSQAESSGNEALIVATLQAHGVGSSSSSVAAFLLKGWEATKPPQSMPQDPPEKVSLLIQSWELLAMRIAEIQKNPPLRAALSGLSLRYARGQFPENIVAFVDQDVLAVEPAMRAAGRSRRIEFLRYNGMIALGFFGDGSPAVLQAARGIFDSETRPIAKVAYAKTVALQGDPTVGDFLVQEAMKANSTSSVAAVDMIYILFNRAFGMTATMAAKPRAQVAEEIGKWWSEYKKQGLKVDREAAIVRQMHGVARPNSTASRPDLSTVRGLLRAAGDIGDVANRRGSRTAWAQLDAMKMSLLPQLEPVLKNKDEDLDIRQQAIRWYVRLKGDKSKGMLRKLQKDPNPEIAETATKFLAVQK